MKKALIFIDWFYPGYKGGGPIQSCFNLVKALEKDVQIFVVTSNCDYEESIPYKAVAYDEWCKVGETRVMYCSKRRAGLSTFKKLIKTVVPDVIYINSMFSPVYSLLPLISGKLCRHSKIILAPRGMLIPEALEKKAFKKRFFLRLAKIFRLYNRISFHATNREEEEHIKAVFGKSTLVHVIENFPSTEFSDAVNLEKLPGYCKCLIVSRVVAHKNISGFLQVIKGISKNLEVCIVGPIEEQEEWALCKTLIGQMPANIKVNYAGAVANKDLQAYYQSHHLFVLLSKSENFGHVIFDAFRYGRPVLISDRTPWKDLQAQKLGWDVNISDASAVINSLNAALDWDQCAFDMHVKACTSFARDYIAGSKAKAKYLEMFS